VIFHYNFKFRPIVLRFQKIVIIADVVLVDCFAIDRDDSITNVENLVAVKKTGENP